MIITNMTKPRLNKESSRKRGRRNGRDSARQRNQRNEVRDGIAPRQQSPSQSPIQPTRPKQRRTVKKTNTATKIAVVTEREGVSDNNNATVVCETVMEVPTKFQNSNEMSSSVEEEGALNDNEVCHDGIEVTIDTNDSEFDYSEPEFEDDNHSESDGEPDQEISFDTSMRNQTASKGKVMVEMTPEMKEMLDQLMRERGEKKRTNDIQSTPKKGKKAGKTNLIRKIPLVKSPSDTMLYKPALLKNPSVNEKRPQILLCERVEADSQDLNDKEKDSNSYIDHISDFVEAIRFEQDNERQHGRESRGDQPGTSGLNRMNANPELAAVQARTEKMVLDAERFKATIAAPQGNEIVPYHNLHRDNYPMVPGGPSDDKFFHLTCHIDKSLRAKIEKGEFVELEKLLPREKSIGGAPLADNRMEWIYEEGQTFLAPVSNRQSKITNIRKWEQAFRVYAAIYSGANPSRAQEIWQYVYVINLAASTYTWDNVANYDYTFRQLMEFNPKRSWAITYRQMWNLAMRNPIMPQTDSTINARFGNRGDFHVKKKSPDYCWSFNKGQKCKFGPKCRFIERCSYCDAANHSVVNCHKLHGKKDKDSNNGGKVINK